MLCANGFFFRILQIRRRTRAVSGDLLKFVIGAEHCHRQCGGLTARLSKYRDCSDEGAQETASVRGACRREKISMHVQQDGLVDEAKN